MPDWSGDVRERLRGLRLSPAREAEIVEELSQHLEERHDSLRRRGVSEEEARRLALEELREPEALATYMGPLRQARVPAPVELGSPGGQFPSGVWQDLRYAGRTLRKQPGFTAAAILTLALGIGANSAIFALVDATLLRALPFPNPQRLMMLWERTGTDPHGRVSPVNMRDWNERSRSFEQIAGFVPSVGGMVMAGAGGMAETVSRQWVTAGIFETLGIRPVAGRTFLPSEDSRRAKVVVLNEAFWRTRFGGDPSVVGREIRFDGAPYTVVGIVPKEAEVIGQSSMWAMVSIKTAPERSRGAYVLQTIGRLKPGVTREAAAAEMAGVTEGLAQEYPKTNQGRGVTIEPLRDAVIGSDLRQTSLLFLGVVGFVLLICCGNVANLLLTRATARRHELAVRAALGAGRWRVMQQLLTESLALSAIGGGIGLAFGAAILRVAPLVVPSHLLPATVTLAVDWRVAVFCAATALLVGALFGLAPAWQATGFSSALAIRSGARTTTSGGGLTRKLLVAGEVATAVVLLYGAGLLLRTLLAVSHIDRGYRASSALTMIVDPLGSKYPTQASLLQFFRAVDDEVGAVPGVKSVAWASTLPLGPSYAGRSFVEIVGAPARDEGHLPSADYQIVSASYFRTLDLPVVAGRAFDDRDTPSSAPVCMVNEAFVRAHVQGRSPIGLKVAIRPVDEAGAKAVVREVVGVARQVKGRPDEAEDLMQVYVPMTQDAMDDMFLVVRPTSGLADGLAPGVRGAIARVDKESLVSVRSVMTLENVAWEATARQRFRAVLVVSFAALALVLAMIGLAGTLAYSIQQQTRDFGVRRALGATTVDVLRLVGRTAAPLIVAGGLAGLGISAGLARLLRTVLFGVAPLDPLTFASVTLLLTATAVVATAAPAWRATRIDPVVALRGE